MRRPPALQNVHFMAEGPCPFSVGDTAIWTHRSGKVDFPEKYGLSRVGVRVKATEIVDGPFEKCLTWQGMKNYPSSGLHWSQFSPAD